MANDEVGVARRYHEQTKHSQRACGVTGTFSTGTINPCRSSFIVGSKRCRFRRSRLAQDPRPPRTTRKCGGGD